VTGAVRRQRSRLRPLFGVEILARCTETIVRVTDEVVESWNDSDDVDLYREWATIAVRIIAVLPTRPSCMYRTTITEIYEWQTY
jgi:cytochrome P450